MEPRNRSQGAFIIISSSAPWKILWQLKMAASRHEHFKWEQNLDQLYSKPKGRTFPTFSYTPPPPGIRGQRLSTDKLSFHLFVNWTAFFFCSLKELLIPMCRSCRVVTFRFNKKIRWHIFLFKYFSDTNSTLRFHKKLLKIRWNTSPTGDWKTVET